MDLSTGLLLAVVAVLALNQAAMRVERLRNDDRVYWAVQFIDLVMASAIILFGLPGFESFPAVPIVVGLLFVFHVAQNYNARAQDMAEDRADERAEIEAEAEARRERRAAEEAANE